MPMFLGGRLLQSTRMGYFDLGHHSNDQQHSSLVTAYQCPNNHSEQLGNHMATNHKSLVSWWLNFDTFKHLI